MHRTVIDAAVASVFQDPTQLVVVVLGLEGRG